MINPDRSKPWNELPDLPPPQTRYASLRLYELLGNAKAALGKLQGRSIAIPNPGILVNTISLQEAKASSEVEHIFTTDDELYKAYSETGSKAPQGATKEVLNYREALWAGNNYLLQQQSFDMGYFKQIYQKVTLQNDGIRNPVAQTYIKTGGTGPQAGKPAYTPPRGKGILEEKFARLVDFLNDDEAYPMDPLLKMAMAHYQFEAIHPFRDGNGRTGRIMNIHYLTHKGLLDFPILFLSRYILQNKADYYEGLAGVSQRADWETWLGFMLKAVESTATHTYVKINDILAARQAILEYVAEQSLTKPEALVNALFTQPYTRVVHLTQTDTYAENTARKYLDGLAKAGILEKRMIQGSSYYLNLELYRILAE